MFSHHHCQPEINSNQIGSTVGEEDHVSASAAHIPYNNMDEIHNSIYAAASDLIPNGGSQLLGSHGANQLKISFRGQVYVFDAVGPQKVVTFAQIDCIIIKSVFFLSSWEIDFVGRCCVVAIGWFF